MSQSSHRAPQPKLPIPPEGTRLGCVLGQDGASFRLWAPRATRVELALLTRDREQSNLDMELGDGGVWSAFAPGVGPGQLYGYRVHGPWSPETGQRFNPARLLLDPYARAITSGVDYAGPIHDHTSESDYLPDTADSSHAVPLSVVVGETPPPTPLARPLAAAERVIFETHVRGYTCNHPLVPEHLRGTYLGLSYPAVIDYFKSIGVTTIELLPIHHFVSEPFVVRSGLSNYWGYNTLGFFAPHAAYASAGTLGEQVDEFKQMTAQFHEAGLEVFLDVVYNHTGEGGHEGPTLSFRGIDHSGYYRLTEDLRNDYDVTGCGNSLDTSQPGVLKLVLDSMRYWVQEMGVDGFRFDLATELVRDSQHYVDHEHPFKRALAEDPLLKDIVVIAEPWDVGPYGYQLGAWGSGWGEWNGKYRDYIRDFWRGATPGVQELATRLSGSPDLFDHDGRPATASVNFVACHDGFALRDLVTYNGKHNEANREANRDGSDDNRSWNCGVEGETDDEAVVALRQRQVRNFLATVLLSHGTPMLAAGDEMGRTQQGNNNAYCQDSPISWVSWDPDKIWEETASFTSQLTTLRAAYPALRPETFLHGEEVVGQDGRRLVRPNVAWLNGYDGPMKEADWHDAGRKLLGMYCSTWQDTFIIWFYAGADPTEVVLPGRPWGDSYHVLLHTGEADELPPTGQTLAPGDKLTLPGRTVVITKAAYAATPRPGARDAAPRPSQFA